MLVYLIGYLSIYGIAAVSPWQGTSGTSPLPSAQLHRNGVLNLGYKFHG